jgi:hypothetical protein
LAHLDLNNGGNSLRFRGVSRFLTAFIAVAAILLATGVSTQAAPVKLTHANAGYTINTALGSPYIGSSVVPLTATTWGPVNSQGVVQVKINNVVVYHPVNSAWFINQMLSSYRVTKNREYLRRAEATTRYILSGSFSDASGATWFPYNFRHTPGNKIDMGRPWYSGMAQGMMLSTLVNLMSCGAAPRRCGFEKTSLWLGWVAADDGRAAVDAAVS